MSEGIAMTCVDSGIHVYVYALDVMFSLIFSKQLQRYALVYYFKSLWYIDVLIFCNGRY